MPQDSIFIRQLVQIWDPNDVMAQPVLRYSGRKRIDYGAQRSVNNSNKGPRIGVGIGKGNLSKGLGIGKGNLSRGELSKKRKKKRAVDNVTLS